jgi:hypothetical protein
MMYHRVQHSPGQTTPQAGRTGRRSVIAILVALAASLVLATAAQAAPTGGQPSISGGTTEPAVLTETQGAWTGTAPITLTEQWYDCSSNAASSCTTPISGATGTSYTTGTGDVGKWVAVSETAADSTGTASPVTSNLIGPIVPPAPTLSSAPTVTGTVASAGTLTATSGSWNNSPTSYNYQWLACTGSPLTCAAATGTNALVPGTTATTATYSVPAAEAGDAFEIQVTAINAGGSTTAPPSAADSPAAPTIGTPGPAITGTVAVGQVLTASTGTWNGSPYAYAYQWERCTGSPLTCTAITGATATTYTLAAADAGTTIEVQVTATNAGGSASATSAGSALTAPPALIAPPGIGGTAQQGQTLTETAAHWSNTPTTIAIQWYLCNSSYTGCAAIAGATGSTFVPTATDVGGVLQLTETATNAGGSATAYSQFVGPVLNPSAVIPVPVNTSLPTLAGGAQQGSVMSATTGAWSDNPGTFIYQWVRCSHTCSAIPGANGSSYALTAGDVGNSIAVQVTAANTGGSGGTVQSAKTAVVTTPTSTSLLASTAALVTDQGVTLTATVSSGTSTVPPNGSLSFTNNGAPIKGCGNLSMQPRGQTGTMTCQTSFVASTANVTAVYSPPSGSLATGSNSPVTQFVVGRARARVTVNGPSRPAVRTKTTFTVKVGPPSGSAVGGANPSGFVRLTDGSRTISGCGHLKLRRQTVTCKVTYRILARHRIAAAYAGDRNFQPTTSGVKIVTVAPLRPTGFVSALMGWTFRFTTGSTTVTQLEATNLSPGMTITITCQGGGCPFHTHRVPISSSQACGASSGGCSVNLLPALHGAHLRPGARLTVRITHPMWIGKYYQFVIVAGQRPQVIQNCLAANSNLPGLGCTGV